MPIYTVITCGGGTRIWPASSAERPKPFIPLVGPRSVFQGTAARAAGIEGLAQLVVIANHRYANLIQAQLVEPAW